ncbi:hypothetical protein XAP412_230038 [Xanthomonas phaseoli pv. phaseoli]|uniref:Secreted protein n=1 Tax=Xanthomonas campestris pv. phaseoli TaxID=317013 RepID=A0AB38DYK3_XANCH|nr:hypothetical protein XAP6984_300039 [Xanthomonas phaseoli pv. phaseoli]SON81281.1 hypothetical protein XAP412_230038 [Xanthomonas phaseoli pv. phaseoli]SON85987.1 hypothetical protein XAP7430_250039 [Xanthomonas phaseoli pv. phaseoli]
MRGTYATAAFADSLHFGCAIVTSQPRCRMFQATHPLSVLTRRVDSEPQPVLGLRTATAFGFPCCTRLR